ncbi:hypothetical protein [Telluribacter humicola]|uniref:hypothetical protein n=1 Tax=Telluribacter humicola TaxID=1720261 RepID=UPI001A95AE16|nr:hypothetical protein [Telluribacter humicola]
MDNIDIEKKKRGFSWLYILGLILLIAVLGFLFWPKDISDEQDDVVGLATTEEMAATDDNYAADDRTASDNNAMSQPVSSYVQWANNISQNEMGVDHEFTKNGLMNMADALAAVAERTPNVNRDQFNNKLNTMRNKANAITNNWESTSHANKIKDAFQASADVFAEIQRTSFQNMQQDVQGLKNEIQEMDTSTMTLEQKSKVKDVFRQAADVLQKMEQNRAS